jgi:hypothetical protein
VIEHRRMAVNLRFPSLLLCWDFCVYSRGIAA